MPEGALTGEFAIVVMWLLFAAASALAILLGGILSYHWVRFAMNAYVPAAALVLYAIGVFLLLSTMFGAIVSLS
ncbi:hypothetical protein HY969_01105 [Candidatus Kaiserbacteria bacterium]|nr:hypothetical protein [Candidatus Kaiserbacteria bacterium]